MLYQLCVMASSLRDEPILCHGLNITGGPKGCTHYGMPQGLRRAHGGGRGEGEGGCKCVGSFDVEQTKQHQDGQQRDTDTEGTMMTALPGVEGQQPQQCC